MVKLQRAGAGFICLPGAETPKAYMFHGTNIYKLHNLNDTWNWNVEEPESNLSIKDLLKIICEHMEPDLNQAQQNVDAAKIHRSMMHCSKKYLKDNYNVDYDPGQCDVCAAAKARFESTRNIELQRHESFDEVVEQTISTDVNEMGPFDAQTIVMGEGRIAKYYLIPDKSEKPL
jgi:hypothetical protein